MTPQEYEALVRTLTAEAERDPGRFERRVLVTVLVGYGYLVGVLALTLLLTAALVASLFFMRLHGWLVVKALVPLVAFTFLVVRALWVRFPDPGGRTILRDDAPALFDEIEQVRDRLGVRRPDEVRVTPDLNASVTQVPVLGFAGPCREVLLVGVQLMQALTPAQFRAVLAHEFGHLSGQHGRFGSWIYRLRHTWGTLLEQLEKKHGDSGPFGSFLQGYAPRFQAQTFVLARRHEYVADRAGAEATSPRDMGSALVALAAAGRRLGEQVWSNLEDRVRDEAEPPADIVKQIGRFLSAPPAPADARRWVQEALVADTGLDDTHPALGDRLAALGVSVEDAAGPPDTDARAIALLGPARETLEEQYSAEWRRVHADDWHARHSMLEAAREVHDALAARPEDTLTAAEFASLAARTFELYGRERAHPVYERLLGLHPDEPHALHWVGSIRLEHGDDSGLAMLERAAELDEDAVIPGAVLAIPYLETRGREPEAAAWRGRAGRQEARISVDRREREGLPPEVGLEPHGLDDAAIAPMRARLGGHPAVTVAYLARKRLTVRPEPPQFVLAVPVPARGMARMDEAEARELVEWLAEQVELPGPTHVIVLHGVLKRLERHLKAVPGARIL